MKIVWQRESSGLASEPDPSGSFDYDVIPRVGEAVVLDGDTDGMITEVVHYPFGDDDQPGPYVFVTLR